MGPTPEELARAGRLAWPDLDIPEDELLAYIRARAHDDIAPARAADLTLACACARGDERAIAAFERAYFGEVDVAAARTRAGPSVADEVKQVLRQLLFVPGPRRLPAVASYSGRGDLRGWVRVTATREVLHLLARSKREVKIDDEELLDALSPAQDPELGYIRDLYRKELTVAFHAAVASLDARQRGLLRSALLDGLGVEALGKLHGVHKATASRWLAAARQTLLDRTRAGLAEKLAISGGEVDSILRLMQSRIDVSLERVLRSKR